MYRNFSKIISLIPLTVGIWLVFQPNLTSGHNGGEPRIVDVKAGDFRLSVWTLPVPLETGELNFIVFVAESSISEENSFVRANTPVLDADIEMIIEPDGGGELLKIKPNHDLATNKLFYETYFAINEPGNFTGTVLVTSDDGKTGEASFSFEVAQGITEINWLRYSGFATLLVAIGWLVWQSRLDYQDSIVKSNQESK